MNAGPTTNESHAATWHKPNSFIKKCFQILLFSFLAPVGWIAVIAFFFKKDVIYEISTNPYLYIYMLVCSAFVFSVFGAYIGRNEKKSAALALHDPLTGLYNVRYFYYRLAEAYVNVDRSGTPLAVILIDLDYFKKINDTYGHPVGDEVLKSVSKAIMNARRINETAARVGGEEFVLLLPNCNLAQAVQVAERVRKTIKEERIVLSDGTEIRVTASIGVAATESYEPDGEKKLYSDADTALYRAKRNGRDLTIAIS